jgi:carboxypeptidase T
MRYRITINGRDKAAMVDLVRKHEIEVFDHGIRSATAGGYTVTALATPQEIQKLQQSEYHVVQHEDADKLGKLRQRQVGVSNRYKLSASRRSRRLSSRRTRYLNVEEVESAIGAAAEAPYSGIAKLIALPYLTWEGRQCHALRIGSQSGADRTCVYFLGGVHAREWGSCDILINFIEQVEQAYVNGTFLTFGRKTFEAADIKRIVDTLDILIFPQANPDGRHYSMTSESEWRKNRRPAREDFPQCPGVDLNRNYDFLWDFPRHFSPSAQVVTSAKPCSIYYNGESAFSEPETRNVRWLADQFPNTRFFVDLHSSGQNILYRWGDDDDQSIDPNMNFMNPSYDSVRGDDGPYKEYLPAADLATLVSLGTALRDGIKAVRGSDYVMASAYSGLYPTSGASDDYFYCRHFVEGSRRKVLSYTLEWGAEFQPAYVEMRHIIDEITAGLLAFCLEIVGMH